MRVLKAAGRLLIDAAIAWSQDKASLYAAAIAYYMVFSIAPLLTLSVAIAGRVFGRAAVEGQLVAQAERFIGEQAALLLQNVLQNAVFGASSFTLISVAIVLWAASGVFSHLKRALDIIYGVIPIPTPGIKGAIHAVRTRFLTFAMVLLISLLLLASLALNTVATMLGDYLTSYLPEVTAFNTSVTRFITPLAMLLLFSILFKMLPEALVAWRDVWLGAGVTTLLVLFGFYLINLYLRFVNVGSVYGAASSLIVVLVWVYYSSQIVMYGAEFTKIYANRYGRRIVPRKSATSLAEFYNNGLVSPEAETAAATETAPQSAAATETARAPAAANEQAVAGQTRRQLAAGLIGIALGLFIAFLSQFWRDD